MYRVGLAISIIMLIMIMVVSVYPTEVYAGVFRVVDMVGDWDSIEDTYIKSKSSVGVSQVYLEAPGYRFGGWRGTLSIDLSTETGNNITGYIEVGVRELNISIKYIESFIPGSYGMGDKISNKLIIKVGEDIKRFSDHAESPYDSRLNTRIYFAIENVNGVLWIVVQDPYGKTGVYNEVYYSRNMTYDGSGITLYMKVYKDSGDKVGSIICNLLTNEVEDLKTYDEIQLSTLDYGLNALFYLSMGFLIIAIAFNLIAGRVQREYPQTKAPKVKEKPRERKR